MPKNKRDKFTSPKNLVIALYPFGLIAINKNWMIERVVNIAPKIKKVFRIHFLLRFRVSLFITFIFILMLVGFMLPLFIELLGLV